MISLMSVELARQHLEELGCEVRTLGSTRHSNFRRRARLEPISGNSVFDRSALPFAPGPWPNLYWPFSPMQ